MTTRTLRIDSTAYRKSYEAGWRSRGDLDHADRTGKSSDDAWMDGRSDASNGRAKWHSMTCEVRVEVGWHTAECER
jgi:hypothetical protein